MLFLLQKKEDLTTVGQLYGMCLKKLARVIGIWLPGWYYSGPRALEFTVFSAWWGGSSSTCAVQRGQATDPDQTLAPICYL